MLGWCKCRPEKYHAEHVFRGEFPLGWSMGGRGRYRHGRLVSSLLAARPGGFGLLEPEAGKPLTTDRPYVGKNKMVVRLTDSLFPLSDDGETVNMVWSFLDIWWVPLRERSWNGVVQVG